MSRKLVTLVYERRCGSMLRKAVLACMADRANDNGAGIWMGKGRIADEIEASRRAVITCIQSLVADGILIDHGKKHRSTYEYEINVRALNALPRSYLGGVQKFTPDPFGGVQICAGGVNPVHRGCEPSSHEPLINQELSYSDERQIRAAEVEALSAMRAQGLASPIARQVIEGLRDLHRRGKVSLRDIDNFKWAVRGVNGETLILKASYEPPGPVAELLARYLEKLKGDEID
jgi:hypothetical protein